MAILETQNEDEQRTAGDLIAVTELEGGRFGPTGDVAVDQTEPALAFRHLGKRELHDIVVGIGNQQESRVIATPLDAGRLRTAIQEHAETPCFGIFPLPLIHFLPGGREPGHVFDVEFLVVLAHDEAAAMQNGVRLANRDQPARELTKTAALGSDVLPVEPVYRVVLRVGVVVAALGMAEFVAGQDHGRALGEQKRRQEIALLARPQLR